MILPLRVSPFRFAPAVAFLLAACSAALAGSIKIDGKTATSVGVGAGGQVRIDIAPTNAKGISHNSYSQFDVTSSGVLLNNTAVGANTIINEVTSQRRSLIEGPLEVLGAKADVILANPNGITVNGGSFINTGRAALIAGKSIPAASTDHSFQVQGGDVRILSGGLSAKLEALDLIAKQVLVDGPLDIGEGQLRLRAGEGQSDLSTSATDWLKLRQDAASKGAKITVSAGAHLSGGTIRIEATGQGAGVHLAGSGLAQAGHFQISSEGYLHSSATLSAKGSLTAKASTITLAAIPTQKPQLTSTDEAIWLHADQSLSLTGTHLNGAGRSTAGVASGASLSLLADQLSLDSTSLIGNGAFVEARSSKDLAIKSSRIESDKSINMSGETLLLSDTSITSKGHLNAFASGNIKLAQVTAAADLGQSYEAQDFWLQSSPTSRSTLTSKNAGLSFKLANTFRNDGGLIEGLSQTHGDVNSLATITVRAGGAVHNSTISTTSIGAIFAKDGKLLVEAGTDIDNASGRLLSNGAIEITSKTGSIANRINGARYTPAQGSERSGSRWFWHEQERWQDFGSYVAGREVGQITAVKDVTVHAHKDLENIGGQISGANVTLTADNIENSAQQLGHTRFSRSCFWIICRTRGSSTTTFDGGSILASKQLNITAKKQFYARAGLLSGASGILLEAPHVNMVPIHYSEYFQIPAGIHNFFLGEYPLVLQRRKTGFAFSKNGKIRLIASGVARLQDTRLTAKGDVELPGNVQQITSPPLVELDPDDARIGWFAGEL
ncbi:filamentous hemagglutinin N-terminal domain-containing protein [Polycladidibacter hongkongensis]|uniref:filamentous hemagglutinin N-terminal domain-containing protein n=1 Tax=Polycladidibacter hongkongensis TaxID=1647556 RepID=UPI00082D7FFD|nr:filamentous hemagglutinin N-terminal domain-containing protein [Pseudovibrio hongkongensis]